MDFFQAQDSARRRTKLLVFYFVTAVVLIIAVVYVVALFVKTLVVGEPETALNIEWWQPEVFALAAGGSLAVIIGGSAVKSLALRGGGGKVARSMGGVLIRADTTDAPQHRRLLNVVEEMAIASGTRVPEVYVLPEPGINAFAAGHTPDDAAVAVTEGALATLSRDELQGVIGHEFSHILNGDMKMNVRLIGLLFGILLIALIGRGLIQSMRFTRMSSGRNKNSGGIVMALVVGGIALIIVGYIGVLFGRLIQAAVSRQREFLADASAVQFTRNPDGIAGALKRIGGAALGSRVANTHATEASHMFFANAMQGSAFNLFATHPPIDARIRAIEPSFDGNYAKIAAPPTPRSERDAATPRTARTGGPPPLRPEQFIAAIAAIGATDQVSGGSVLNAIPDSLREAAHDPARARTVILALLATHGDETAVKRQEAALAAALGPGEKKVIAEIVAETSRLPASARLPLADLALPAIRSLPDEQIDAFLSAARALVAADERTTLFEFSLMQVITRYLLPSDRTGERPGMQVMSYQPLVDEIAAVLTTLARAGSADPATMQRAFNAGASQLGLIRDRLALQTDAALAPERLAQALKNLERAAAPIKRNFLEAMARTAAADGVVMPAEVELLRAVSAAIDCPAPPLNG